MQITATFSRASPALEFPYYGYRRITAELQNRGYAVNHKRVLRLMRQEKLLCYKKKFKPVTTDSTHGLPVYPNLLKGREITGLNQAWASDITYVQLQHEHKKRSGHECSGKGIEEPFQGIP